MNPDLLSLRNLARDELAELVPNRLFDLGGKVAIVTGSTGGLGEWLAAGLGAAGASLLLTDRPGSDFTRLESALEGSGIEWFVCEADLSDRPSRVSIIDAATERFGRVDVLVNNAGVNRRERIMDVSDESWDWIADIDLRVPYELSRAAARSMTATGGGSIIHIGSLNNAIGLEGVSVYGAHKAALCQTAKAMAVEWTRSGIRVNVICPGFMLTPLSRPLWLDPVRGRWILDRSPMRRPGYPAELVGALLLLASDAGSFITGQALYVDGGWLAGTPWSVTLDEDGAEIEHP